MSPPFGLALALGILLPPAAAGPLGFAARRLSARIAQRAPGLVARLAPFAGRTVTLAPTDLPFRVQVALTGGAPEVTVTPAGTAPEDAPAGHARIAGAFRDLVALAEARTDGDALFFSRRLSVAGDMELVLALRNAIDGADLDLARLLAPSVLPQGALSLLAEAAGALDARLQEVGAAIRAPLARDLDRQGRRIAALEETAAMQPRSRARKPGAAA